LQDTFIVQEICQIGRRLQNVNFFSPFRYCEEVVSHDHAPAALGPAVVPEKVSVLSDSTLREMEKDKEAATEEPRRGLFGRLIGS
jgi:hypothetical protein